MVPGMLRNLSELDKVFPPRFIACWKAPTLGHLPLLNLIPTAPQQVELIEGLHAHVLKVPRLKSTLSKTIILKAINYFWNSGSQNTSKKYKTLKHFET